jgi:hypothetical protein
MKSRIAAALMLASAGPLASQTPAASLTPPPADQQIAAAVLSLPPSLRADATVLGYGTDGKLVPLRKGTGSMICLANNPKGEQFHVACYHDSMEPFMARGRSLRASGVTGGQVDSVRFREIKEGKLSLPTTPAALYQLFGGSFDPVKNEVTGARALYVVKAHIMFTPTM